MNTYRTIPQTVTAVQWWKHGGSSFMNQEIVWLETAHFLPDSGVTVLLAWWRNKTKDEPTMRTGRWDDHQSCFVDSKSGEPWKTKPNYFCMLPKFHSPTAKGGGQRE